MMNILFISSCEIPDYQSNTIFHGLCRLPNMTVYTNADLWYMFEGNEPEQLLKSYGKGFSLYNRLDPCLKRVEESSVILKKIKEKFYTTIIYGSILRCSLFLEDVLKVYAKNEIFFIEGEDTDFSFYHSIYCINGIRSILYNLKNSFIVYKNYHKAKQLSKKGIYFKRELRACDRKYFYPISFAIPEENIIRKIPEKTMEKAFIVPGDLRTYIYDNEEDYYKGYAISKYAVTTRKGGWDCLRHYEILANACIPYFPDIEKCPHYTMCFFPKNIIKETNRLIEDNKLNSKLFEYYNNMLLEYTKKYLTTKSLAQYVLSFLPK